MAFAGLFPIFSHFFGILVARQEFILAVNVLFFRGAGAHASTAPRKLRAGALKNERAKCNFRPMDTYSQLRREESIALAMKDWGIFHDISIYFYMFLPRPGRH